MLMLNRVVFAAGNPATETGGATRKFVTRPSLR